MTPPLFSIVTPVYNTPVDVLRLTIDSVVRQSWRDWELILVDDHSSDPDVLTALHEASASDSRVHVVARAENGGISSASNDGLNAATGQFLVLLDHDDVLAHGALARIAEVLLDHEDIDFLYTDEDKVDEKGNRYDAFAKPDWSPERLRGQMYTGHLSVMRMSLVRKVGGFDSAFDGSQDHDLVLKVTEQSKRIYHLPEVLYHWRSLPESTASSGEVKPYAWDAGVRAVSAHLARVGIDAKAERGSKPGTYVLRRAFDSRTTVSVIIPTRGGRGTVLGAERVFVVEAVRSLLANTRHEALEIVVVYDSVTPRTVLEELSRIAGSTLTLVEYDRKFNYSEKCNLGFVASSGEVIILLNDDVEVLSEGFIEEMAAPLAEGGVGMTGAYLLFEDGQIQHGGHQYAERHYRHAFHGFKDGDSGPFSALLIDREVSGVTAACAAITRTLYAEVGGLSEALPANFNDVDLCLKVQAAGQRILWLHGVKLYHFESRTRVPRVHQWEVDRARARWGVRYIDPFVRPEH